MSDNAPRQIANFPPINMPIASQDGRITQNWQQLLTALWVVYKQTVAVPTAQIQTLTTSPFTFTSTTFGNLWVQGGTGIGQTLTRSGTALTISPLLQYIPVAPGDVVSVVFTTPPTVTFLSG